MDVRGDGRLSALELRDGLRQLAAHAHLPHLTLTEFSAAELGALARALDPRGGGGGGGGEREVGALFGTR